LAAVKVAVVFRSLVAMVARVVGAIPHQAQAVRDRKVATGVTAQALATVVAGAVAMVMAQMRALLVPGALAGFRR